MVCASQTLYHDPVDGKTKDFMQFRLVYAGGLLKSAGYTKRRAWEKHSIRRYLHTQLKNIWAVHPALKFYGGVQYGERSSNPGASLLEILAKNFERSGIGFVPIVTEANGLVCELDVLFLRPERPGRLIGDGGDIDNRMKVLMDALRIPSNASEMVRKEGDEPDPNPMYCLLEDDSLVTTFKVTTDRLLLTMDEGQNEACVIIHVNLMAVDPFASPYELHF